MEKRMISMGGKYNEYNGMRSRGTLYRDKDEVWI